METVLITGGTGMIGSALTKALLEKSYHVIVLSRSAVTNNTAGNLSYARWDVENQGIDMDAVAQADYIVHLAGAGIADKRWTKRRKREIVDSRVKSGELLVKTLASTSNRVKAVISSSAIGWYGSDPMIPNSDPFTEDGPADTGFLGTTCRQWEKSVQPLESMGKRVIWFRTGIVLEKGAGALPEFVKPLRFGVAAILGSGKQIISWIHIEDLVRMVIHAIEDKNMHGVYNAVAPQPLSNKEFTLLLARQKRGRFFVPIYIPSFVVKIVLGEMSIEVLKSATVSDDKIRATGFEFLYPAAKEALENLLNS